MSVLLSYIHAPNHKSTEDDIMSAYHTIKKIAAQHCFERNTALDRNGALRIVLGHGTLRSGSRGTVNCFTPTAIFKIFL
jgi:hypothetical protein